VVLLEEHGTAHISSAFSSARAAPLLQIVLYGDDGLVRKPAHVALSELA
jgi:hypothetical protein